MNVIEIPIPLDVNEAKQLAEIAESKRCTVIEMIEEAVSLLIAREGRRAGPGSGQ
jgi:uncharacterized OsmC-like protein